MQAGGTRGAVPRPVGRGRPVRARRRSAALCARGARRARAGHPRHRPLRLRGRARDGRRGARHLPGRVRAAMMHVRELGEGPPVLLLHPGPGLDGTVFMPGVELLARSHRVLLADLPGNGHSPEGDRDEWTLAGYARAVERLAQDLELRDWTLLGHSFGGFVAMQHLVDFPDSTARIIASCTDASETPPPGEPEDPLAGLTGEQRERIAEGEARELLASSPQQLKDAWLEQAPRLAVSEAALMRMLRDVLFR